MALAFLGFGHRVILDRMIGWLVGRLGTKEFFFRGGGSAQHIMDGIGIGTGTGDCDLYFFEGGWETNGWILDRNGLDVSYCMYMYLRMYVCT